MGSIAIVGFFIFLCILFGPSLLILYTGLHEHFKWESTKNKPGEENEEQV